MTRATSRYGPRAAALIAAVAIEAGLVLALIFGLGIATPSAASEELALFGIAVEPPPPPKVKIVPRPKPSKRPEGAASPPNLRSKRTEIVAPEVPVLVPPPIVAALVADVGRDATAGSADVVGPGTGSGGIGNGTGSGGAGDGDGGGGSEIAPRWLKGRLKDSDYPADAAESGIAGTVGVRYVVTAKGRVADCDVTRSSGHAELDTLTCRLIQQRFRFAPSRDAAGRAVESVIVENHSWMTVEEPEQERPTK